MSVSVPTWAPDGRRFAFTVDEPDGIAVWVADAQAATAAEVPGLRVRDVLGGDPTSAGSTVRWSRDGSDAARARRGRLPPAAPGPEPIEPQLEEAAGKRSQMATFTDLLRTDADADLFEELATTVPLRVDPDSGAATELGPPGLYYHLSESPGRRAPAGVPAAAAILVPGAVPVLRPPGRGLDAPAASWSASSPICRSATRCRGRACRPARGWCRGRSPMPASLVWAEAQDGGDPLAKAEYRDQICRLPAPFDESPQPCIQVQHRCLGWYDMAAPGQLLITEHDRDRRWLTSRLRDLAAPQDSRVIFDHSADEAYRRSGHADDDRASGRHPHGAAGRPPDLPARRRREPGGRPAVPGPAGPVGPRRTQRLWRSPRGRLRAGARLRRRRPGDAC